MAASGRPEIKAPKEMERNSTICSAEIDMNSSRVLFSTLVMENMY
jgi:hypothetical protein